MISDPVTEGLLTRAESDYYLRLFRNGFVREVESAGAWLACFNDVSVEFADKNFASVPVPGEGSGFVHLSDDIVFDYGQPISPDFSSFGNSCILDAASKLGRTYIVKVSELVRSGIEASVTLFECIEVKPVSFGHYSHVVNINNVLAAVRKDYDRAGFPRYRRYCIVSPSLSDVIEGMSKDAFDGGYMDFLFVLDDTMPPDNHNMYFGVYGKGISYCANTEEFKLTASNSVEAWGTPGRKAVPYVSGTTTCRVLVNQPSALRLVVTEHID